MQKVNPETELRHAMSKLGIEPKCLAAEEIFIDYIKPPSRLEAQFLCNGCPLLELCDSAAQKKRPAWGVWGGRVYGITKEVRKSA